MSRHCPRAHADGMHRSPLLTKPRVAPFPCQHESADLWFSDLPAELEQAKAHCRGCPVRLACLAGAVERREPCGVWGGEIFDKGVVVARKRPRGRPPKNRAEPDSAAA